MLGIPCVNTITKRQPLWTHHRHDRPDCASGPSLQRSPLPRTTIIPRAQEGDDPTTIEVEFARLLNERRPNTTQVITPSHLHPPPTVLAAVCSALQRNSYPNQDAGIDTAFAFTKPYTEPSSTTGSNSSSTPPLPNLTASGRRARSWSATEAWYTKQEFSLQFTSTTSPYRHFIECDEWEFSSQLIFPQKRSEQRSIQAVRVRTEDNKLHTFTFCMEKEEHGPLKGCWFVVGVRIGDYSV